MLEDIVVDTNVFLHAQTPGERFFQESLDFINLFRTTTTQLCVDEGFNVKDSNRSLIGGEYLENITPGSMAFVIIVELASAGRIKEVSKMPVNSIRRKIDQLIRKKRDRTFLRVAFNSSERILISHDHEDFQANKRPNIRARIGVDVILAVECIPLLRKAERLQKPPRSPQNLIKPR